MSMGQRNILDLRVFITRDTPRVIVYRPFFVLFTHIHPLLIISERQFEERKDRTNESFG